MTKADIVDIVSEGTGLTKVETQAVIDGFLATVGYALKQGERVDLRGFGNFRVTQRQARTIVNPVSKELKKYINTESSETIE